MDSTVRFLYRHWMVILALLAFSGGVALFLSPRSIASDRCEIGGFECLHSSLGSDSLRLRLQNPGPGVMLKQVSLTGQGYSCQAAFSDGWGPFVDGRHVAEGSVAELEIPCTGIPKGKVELSGSVDWFYDDSSYAQAKSSQAYVVASR